jgi:hypothetical protein
VWEPGLTRPIGRCLRLCARPRTTFRRGDGSSSLEVLVM